MQGIVRQPDLALFGDISGHLRVAFVRDADMMPPSVASVRLARDVLLWEERDRTTRLEGDLTLEQALELADSMR